VLVLQPLSAGLAISELRVRAKDLRPVLIVILAGNIVLRNLVRGYFGLVRIRSIFHTADDPSLERLPFFEQLLCALRIHVLRCCRRIYPGEASVSECLEDEKRRLHHDGAVKVIIAPSNPQLSAYVQSSALNKRPGAVVPPSVASDQGTGRAWYVPYVLQTDVPPIRK